MFENRVTQETCSCGQLGRRRRKFTSCSVLTVKFGLCIVLAALLLTPLASCADADPPKTLVSQSEIKTIEPTNNPTKVFVRRRIFRKLVKDSGNSSSEEPPTTSQPTTTSTRPRTLYSLVKRLDAPQSATVTGSTLKSSMSSSQSLASRQKFNFQSLKTRLGLAASGIAATTTTAAPNSSSTQNSSLVMIPLPPSQRKAYTPVIMQVSKSTTAKPEVQTFKLNKMFVPIGIYGKVVENGTEEAKTEPPPSTPATSVRHRGTDSGEKKSRKVKGIAESVDLTYGRPNLARVSLTTQRPDIGQISITTEYNEVFDEFGGGNDVRRGDSHRNKPFGSAALTLMTPPKLGTPSNDKDSPSTLQDALGSYSSYSTYSSPTKKFTPSSIVDSITDSMSRIPGLFHKGLTSLASMTSSLKENPFVDDNFDGNVGVKKQKPLVSAPSSYKPKIPASVPGGYVSGVGGSRDQAYAGSELSSHASKANSGAVDLSEYETLEYFRKRPHLLAQLRRESALRRMQSVRFSKGFKPATAPDAIAREYYKSTSTTQMTPEELLSTAHSLRAAKKLRQNWLLRNSDEYVASKNDKIVRMWRSLLDSFSTDDEPDFESVYSKTRRVDNRDLSSRISARRSGLQASNVLNAQWSSIKRKYSKSDINEAKERILTLLDGGYGDEALHEIADDDELQHVVEYSDTSSHMPPPPPPRIKTLSLTKGLSGAAAGAFKDLIKFFKLGVSVGTGHSHGPVNYENVADAQEVEETGDWKPVRRPIISFSAGISLKNPNPKKLVHLHDDEHEHHVTHYSSSSSPYIPSSYRDIESSYSSVSEVPSSYKGLSGYVHDLASTHSAPASVKPTPYSYPAEEEVVSGAGQSVDYVDEGDNSAYGSDHQGYGVEAPSQYSYSDYAKYSTLKSAAAAAQEEEMESGSESNWQVSVAGQQQPAGGMGDYELVPSSVYLNGGHDPRDIAAVVKPAGVSDDAVRSVLPSGLRNVKILQYPVGGGGHQSLNSISQVLGKGGRREEEVKAFKLAMKKLRENYVAKESAYLPPDEEEAYGQETSVRGVTAQRVSPYAQNIYSSGYAGLASPAAYYTPLQSSGLVGALSGLEGANVFTTANRINNLARGNVVVSGLGGLYGQHHQQPATLQKDDLGFSTNYNLPGSLDPDIAALVKSELDKDDIPDELRAEFKKDREEAKQQERQKQLQAQQQQQQQQAARRADAHIETAQRTLINSLLSSAAKTSPPQQQRYSVPQHQFTSPAAQYVAQQPYKPILPTLPTPSMQSRAFSVHHGVPPPPGPPGLVTTKFFAPVPITPTLMSVALKNPRYASPVPRYVIELAQKLQKDKSVQGIVRVSAKRPGSNRAIEYLYPVKG